MGLGKEDLYVTSWVKTNIVHTSIFGHSVVYKICWNNYAQWLQICMDDKVWFTLSVLWTECFLIDFINHWMTKIRSAKYAGCGSGGHIHQCFSFWDKYIYSYQLLIFHGQPSQLEDSTWWQLHKRYLYACSYLCS